MIKQQIQKYNKKWGYELWIENNPEYCGKLLHIIPCHKCSVHYHKLKKETFYVIDGSLTLEFSKSLNLEDWIQMRNIQIIRLNKGEAFTIERNIAHRFYSNNGLNCDFVEISTHHDEQDSYRIIESL